MKKKEMTTGMKKEWSKNTGIPKKLSNERAKLNTAAHKQGF